MGHHTGTTIPSLGLAARAAVRDSFSHRCVQIIDAEKGVCINGFRHSVPKNLLKCLTKGDLLLNNRILNDFGMPCQRKPVLGYKTLVMNSTSGSGSTLKR